jgi:hypothetical protein
MDRNADDERCRAYHRRRPAPVGAHPLARRRQPDRADLFAHNDIVVKAPADVIWNHLVRASAWPSWYSNASGVVVNASNGMLGPGVTFEWVTFGASIHSTVHEVEPGSRIG